MKTTPTQRRRRSERGIALLLTLAILVLTTILIVAFSVSMRVEQTASANFNDLVAARQLAQGAVDQAVATIRNATPTPTNTATWTAVPGGIIRATGSGNFPTNALYTLPSPANAGTYNLNTNGFITGINSFYNSSSVITAGWQCVTNTLNNRMIGRIAYWVDNESAKINVNLAKWRDPAAINESNPTNIDLRALELPFYNATIGTINSFWTEHSTAPTKPLFTTLEEMRRGFSPLLPVAGFNSNKFYTTVSTAEANTDVFGRSRIDINGVTEADLTDTTSAIRQRLNDSTWATLLYSGIVTDANRNTLQKKYGVFGIEQILANLIEYRRPYNAADIATGADNRNADGIPQRYCGLKKFPFLGEILIHVTTNLTGAAGAWTNTVTIYADARLVNPYDVARGQGGQVKFQMNSIDLDTSIGAIPFVAGELGEKTRNLTADVPSYLHRHLNSSSNIISAEPASNSSWTKAVVSADVVPPVINKVTVRVKQVRLLRTAGDESIHDWAISADFDRAYPGANYMEFSPTSADGGRILADPPAFNGSGTNSPQNMACLGIAKNDMRVRTFPGHDTTTMPNGLNPPIAWIKTVAEDARPTQVAASSILAWFPQTPYWNGNFTQDYFGLLADNRDIYPGTGGGTVPNQTRQSTFSIKEAPFTSYGELSYIHTGYQWRNVRLRASVAYTGSSPAGPVQSDPNRPTYLTVERDALQDWVLLDIFKIDQGLTPGRVNLNSRFLGPAHTLPSRTLPYVALLNACTTNLSVGGTSEGRLNAIASNIVNRVFATGSPYTALPAYFTPGEYCEVSDMDFYDDARGGATYDTWPAKVEREQMIRRLSNLVTARSNLFSIWVMAQSIKKVDTTDPAAYRPDLGDFVAGEVKVQAIVERYEEDSAVKFRTRYYRFLYD
jgi:Tfp pilus assembly protein PilX